MTRGWMGSRGQFDAGDEDRPDYRVQSPPYSKCSFCGEGVTCEHGLCNVCQFCKKCAKEEAQLEEKQ